MTLSEYPGNTYVQQTTFLCFSKATLMHSLKSRAQAVRTHAQAREHSHARQGKARPVFC